MPMNSVNCLHKWMMSLFLAKQITYFTESSKICTYTFVNRTSLLSHPGSSALSSMFQETKHPGENPGSFSRSTDGTYLRATKDHIIYEPHSPLFFVEQCNDWSHEDLCS